MFYRFFYILIKFIIIPLYRINVHGIENLPKDNKFIVCANHKSMLDPIFVAVSLNRQIHFLAKKELFKNPFLRKFLDLLGAYPVERDGKDLGVLRNSIKVLKKGQILGIFPEGTRVKEIKRENVKDGAGFIALKSNTNILPIEIISEYKILKKTNLYIKKPIEISDFKELKSKDAMSKIMDETYEKIYENHNLLYKRKVK
ncbi:1-acyl-sn-glycerol-3-phosphate acyltransferase [Anaerococcus porci]|uniref:1-acyl-sn-glycerol-3-phosphate acyltransferase n=1 Tax=Anaerococcus porci TaxID=2652269 RepID=A0A6N7VTG2_9FIRM|nr:lysophospholipid acyltransferase family protein [Anaerococcus porci]MDY3007164.1 lysophospholipid acyltransferase family protein [Anaerococcus porci]MSS76999.1 1-acyl-sn-glycerol-3-phosphate acyltransferase [Anaerococcus porci]